MKTNLTLENKGSLITIAGTNECLGYLMHFDGRGVFDATLGKVDVSPDEANIHNTELDKAMIEGLDSQCQVGQGGTFYFDQNKQVVHTWSGTLVSDKVHLTAGGKGITFIRNGRQYRGRLQSDADCFNFKRVS